MGGKYFNLQFNRSRTGESEFEGKLRKMAKDNNLSLADTVMLLVMSVDHFKVSYNVDVHLDQLQQSQSQLVTDKFEQRNSKKEVQPRDILDALRN